MIDTIEMDDAEAEKWLTLLLKLLDEKTRASPEDKKPRISALELLLDRCRRAAVAGDHTAGLVLLKEAQELEPLRRSYLQMERSRSHPLAPFIQGRVLSVPPGIDFETVTQWLADDEFTEERAREFARLHAINDERRRLQDPNRKVRDGEAVEVEVLRDLPRRPTPEELAEDEALLQTAVEEAERAKRAPQEAQQAAKSAPGGTTPQDETPKPASHRKRPRKPAG